MTKLLKTAVLGMLALAMIGVGVFAAATPKTLNTTGSVTFTASDVYVDITGAQRIGTATTGQDYSHIANEALATPAAPKTWAMTAIVLNETNFVATFKFTFKNKGSKTAKIVITKAAPAASFTVAGGLETALTAQETTIATGASATFTYTVTLVKFSTTATYAPNFAVTITAV